MSGGARRRSCLRATQGNAPNVGVRTAPTVGLQEAVTAALASALTVSVTAALAAFAVLGALRASPASAATAGVAGSAGTGEAHGSLDAFSAPGVALAWGVLRGRDETTTRVVVRIDADPARFATVEVVGVDPFGGGRKPRLAATPVGGRFDVRTPRADYADFPRTELRFFAPAFPPPAPPALTVFYQGVPDTTPEFDDPARLDAYLDSRIDKAKAQAVGKP